MLRVVFAFAIITTTPAYAQHAPTESQRVRELGMGLHEGLTALIQDAYASGASGKLELRLFTPELQQLLVNDERRPEPCAGSWLLAGAPPLDEMQVWVLSSTGAYDARGATATVTAAISVNNRWGRRFSVISPAGYWLIDDVALSPEGESLRERLAACE